MNNYRYSLSITIDRGQGSFQGRVLNNLSYDELLEYGCDPVLTDKDCFQQFTAGDEIITFKIKTTKYVPETTPKAWFQGTDSYGNAGIFQDFEQSIGE